MQGRPGVEAREDVREGPVAVTRPAGRPVVSIGARPVDEVVTGIELLGLAVVERRGVGAPHPADVLGAFRTEGAHDVAPRGHVLARGPGEVGLLFAVHLPEPADQDGLAERPGSPGPLPDQLVVMAGGDRPGRHPFAVPADHRDPAGLQVPPLDLGRERVLPAVEVVVDVQCPPDGLLQGFDSRLLCRESPALGAGTGAEEHTPHRLDRRARGGRGRLARGLGIGLTVISGAQATAPARDSIAISNTARRLRETMEAEGGRVMTQPRSGCWRA